MSENSTVTSFFLHYCVRVTWLFVVDPLKLSLLTGSQIIIYCSMLYTCIEKYQLITKCNLSFQPIIISILVVDEQVI